MDQQEWTCGDTLVSLWNVPRPLCSSDIVNSLILDDFGVTSCAILEGVL